MKSFSYQGYTLTYHVTYKPIMHLYMRLRGNVWYITASKKFTDAQIESIMIKKFDQLIRKQSKVPQKKQLDRYMIFGQIYEKDAFYQMAQLPHDDRYYDRALKNILTHRIEQLKPWLENQISIVGLKLVPIQTKKLKSKYGSCHLIKRVVTISTFMAKPDEIYLKYVLLHEFAHLVVGNHSKDFYRILEQMMTNHYQIQKELRKIPIIFG